MVKSSNIQKMFYSSLLVIIIASITGTIGMLVDGVLIGRYLGADALAAYGLVSPAFLILHAIGGVFSSGMQAMCAAHLGAGRTKEANGVFSLTALLTFIVSILFALLMLIFSSPIAAFLGAQGNAAHLHTMASDYLVGLSFGLPMILLHQCLQPVMQLDGDKSKVILATFLMTAVDIVGDLLVVHIFKNGLLGMALMTSLSYAVSMLVYVPHFFRKDTVFRLRFKDIPWSETGALLSTGLPTAISRFCNTLRSLLLNHLLLVIAGSVAVTALTAQTNLNNFFASVSTGISMSTLLVVGVLYGEEDRTGIRALMKTALQTGAILVSLLAAVLFLAAPQLVGLYIEPGHEAFSMAVTCVRIFAFSMPLHVIINVFMNYLQGTRNLRKSHVSCILNELVAVVGCAIPFGFLFGVNGVWLAFPVGKALTLLVIALMAWHDAKKVPLHLSDYLFLPVDFDSSPSVEMELQSMSSEEISNAIDTMKTFCIDEGMEQETASQITGAISKLLADILQGSSSSRNRVSADVRLRRTEKSFLIRIRDSGKSKDRSQAARELLPACASVHYVNTMSTNYLHLIV